MGDSTTGGHIDWVAIATFVLALVTVGAIIAPIFQANLERHRRSLSGLRQMRQVVGFFQRRHAIMASDLNNRAELFIQGMDIVLTRALADDIAQLLPAMQDAAEVYGGLFAMYNAMILCIQTPQARFKQSYLHDAGAPLGRAAQVVSDQISLLERKRVISIWIGR